MITCLRVQARIANYFVAHIPEAGSRERAPYGDLTTIFLLFLVFSNKIFLEKLFKKNILEKEKKKIGTDSFEKN